MKGFIEVFPKVWKADPQGDSPYDGEYIPSEKPILIAIDSIMRVYGEYIYTKTVISGQFFSVWTSLTYEEIKELIKSAS